MKKSLLALAVLGAFAGVASAQSSVTLFGIVDLNARYVKNDAAKRAVSLSQDGINSSRLGFRGSEDLGGGMSARFWIEGALNTDTGNAGGQTWQRRSTVSLAGGFGEVRLGRDYTPTFWNSTIFDVFGTNGIGSSLNYQQLPPSTTNVRSNNSIGYFLPPNIGGVYGQGMVAASEGATNTKYIGARIGFAAGPFDIAGAYGQQNANANDKQKTFNIGGSYDLGVVKLMGYFDRDTLVSAKENRFSFSVLAPIGQGEIHASYGTSKLTNGAASTKIDQFAVGYVYNVSKRTALYSTLSRLNNKNGTLKTVGGGNAFGSDGGIPSSPKSTGFEAGLRHSF